MIRLLGEKSGESWDSYIFKQILKVSYRYRTQIQIILRRHIEYKKEREADDQTLVVGELNYRTHPTSIKEINLWKEIIDLTTTNPFCNSLPSSHHFSINV